MHVSVIVPTLNEATCIRQTLSSLAALDGEKEIIVVDGGSEDGTCTVARSMGAQLLKSPRGRGTQMRQGALHSAGDVLWFVHADTVPPRDSLLSIRSALEDDSVVGGNFGLLFDGDSRAAKVMTVIYPYLQHLRLTYGDSGIFIRRTTYEKIGGIRPLALFEDLDLVRRMRRAGRFVNLESRIVTSSRRFENRNFGLVWLQWTTLQVLYWCGVSPNSLARLYRQVRRRAG